LDKKAELRLELTINKGRGYVPAEENRAMLPSDDVQTIAIDSIYTPIRNVKYEIENYRIEQKTDYEKLIIEVTTDGSIQPKDALKEAAKILIQHFALFSDEAKMMVETTGTENIEEFDEEVFAHAPIAEA
jgi:DNA-directed RNA polymerase subunit alpha